MKGISPFKMHKIIYIFSRKPEKILGFTCVIQVGSGYPKHSFFYLASSYVFVSESIVDVTSIDFSPFNQPCFLVSSY